MNFKKHIENAKKSKFGLWKLNFGLHRLIPFNKPHGIKILNLGDDFIETIIPYKKANTNHIKGVHACGLATCAEFCSGLMLLYKLGYSNYRLIMESMDIKFHYQAKTDIIARYSVTDDWLARHIIEPLKNSDKVYIKCEIQLHDTQGNLVATCYTNWQIKDWKKVKTKM